MALLFAIQCYIGGWIPSDLNDNCDRYFLKRRSRTSGVWYRALRCGVLGFSDIQIVTGISILIVTFVYMRSMSIFEYQNSVWLAWMSSNVHLSTLKYLREYFEANPVVRGLRVGGMLTLVIMLGVGLFPMTCFRWQSSALAATACNVEGSCELLDVSAGEMWQWAARHDLGPNQTRTEPTTCHHIPPACLHIRVESINSL